MVIKKAAISPANVVKWLLRQERELRLPPINAFKSLVSRREKCPNTDQKILRIWTLFMQ